MRVLRLPFALVALGGLTACFAAGPPRPGVRRDRLGDPLPPGAVARLGTTRLAPAEVVEMTFSPDGKLLASLDRRGNVRLWEVATGREVRQHTIPPSRSYSPDRFRLAFSPDGKWLASGCPDQTVRVWGVDTGREVHRFRVPGYSPVVAFSPDSRELASAAGGVWRWAVRTGKPLKGWEQEWVSGVRYAPDGKTLVCLSRFERTGYPDVLTTRDASNGKQKVRHELDADSSYARILSPAGRFLASPTRDGRTIRLVDPATARVVRRTEGAGDYPVRLAFSRDDRFVTVSARDGVARVWHTANGKLAHSFHALPTGIDQVALSPGGRLLALTGRVDDAIHIFDVRTRKELHHFPGHRGGALVAAFTADGKSVATASHDPVQQMPVRDHAAWSLRRWDPRTGKELAVTRRDLGGEVHATAFSPDGKCLLSVTHDGLLRLWDVASGKEVRRWTVPHPRWPGAVTFTADGKEVLTTRGPDVLRWDAATGKELPTVRLPLSPRVGDCACLPSPDPEVWLAWDPTANPGEVLVYHHPGGSVLRTYPMAPGWIHRAAVAPDGRTLALPERGKVRLLETATGFERGYLRGAPGWVNALAFSPDGRFVAGGGNPDHDVRVWQLPSGRLVRRLVGHRGLLDSLAFSPDGALLVSAGYENTALVWDTAGAVGARPRLTARELVRLLDALAGPDPARAHRAVWDLVDSPRDSIPMLKALLENAPSAEDRRIFRLVNELGSPRPKVAEAAGAELAKFGARAEAALHQAVREHPEPEVRRRAGPLLARLEPPLRPTLPAGDVIALRALEVLEKVGSPEARKVIQQTARGAGGPRVTREARAALGRLARKK